MPVHAFLILASILLAASNAPAGGSGDCNGNGIPDAEDIAGGTSGDCNNNGLPDECEDCNGNGLADACDIHGGGSTDLDNNGVPDDCQDDCNRNGIPDEGDLADGTSEDCNGNAVLDECDVLQGVALDCNLNGRLDGCDLDPWVPMTLSDAADGARAVFPADVDGDGDLDTISASSLDGKIAWYENVDGFGRFGPERLVDFGDGAWAVHVADLNADDAVDLVVASAIADEIAWYRNDGVGGFWTKFVVSLAANTPRSVFVADVDSDGDPDILSASESDDKIAWYENIGSGTFGAEHVVSAATDGASALVAADLDGDQDIDIVSAASVDNGIRWHENLDGAGSAWTDHLITVATLQPGAVHVADLDGDSDPDILSASSGDDRIAWYPNLDGAGDFSVQVVISLSADEARAVFAADLDRDLDLDVLSASSGDDRVVWYENVDGLGSFDLPQPISDSSPGAWSVFVADVDGDGPLDVLSASAAADAVVWHRQASADCNDDGIPDDCQSDCNDNGYLDACDVADGFSVDCNGTDVPDECETACPGCDVDLDGCRDELDSDALDPLTCSDVDLDGCDDCSSGTYGLADDGPDGDADGFCDLGDCHPGDPATWNLPGSASAVVANRQDATIELSWPPVESPGASSVSFDALRSTEASDFTTGVACLEVDDSDRTAVDQGVPAQNGAFFYLVRVRNACPGSSGNPGTDSGGTPRPAASCP